MRSKGFFLDKTHRSLDGPLLECESTYLAILDNAIKLTNPDFLEMKSCQIQRLLDPHIDSSTFISNNVTAVIYPSHMI